MLGEHTHIYIYRGPGSGWAVESLTMIMASTGKNSKEHVPNLPFSPFFAVHLGFHISVFSVALSRLERYSKDTADFSKHGLTTNQIQMVILGQLLWVKPYLLTILLDVALATNAPCPGEFVAASHASQALFQAVCNLFRHNENCISMANYGVYTYIYIYVCLWLIVLFGAFGATTATVT